MTLERPFAPEIGEADLEPEDLTAADHAAIGQVSILFRVAMTALAPTGIVFDEAEAGPKDMTPAKLMWFVNECVASEAERLRYDADARRRLGHIVRQVFNINDFSIPEIEKLVVVPLDRAPG